MRPLALLAAGLFAGSVMAAPVPKEKAKDEEVILGTWKVEKLDTGGPDGPPQSEVDKIRLVFEKDNGLRVLGGPSGEEVKGTFKIDPSAKPKAFDMTVASPGKGGHVEVMLGLYELDGDALKLCIPKGPNTKRPEEVRPDGKSVAVLTLTRVKDEKKDK
jgi:uncharacterized protein (TIGR03067 family)